MPQGEHGGEQSALQLEDSQGLVMRNCFNVYIQIHHQLLQNLEGLVLGNVLNLLCTILKIRINHSNIKSFFGLGSVRKKF